MKFTWRTICVALGAVLATGIATYAYADALDSATVTETCSNYTIKVAGHGLTHQNAYVLYE